MGRCVIERNLGSLQGLPVETRTLFKRMVVQILIYLARSR